jgi:sporulation protein YlmC with PRC-barrel domain
LSQQGSCRHGVCEASDVASLIRWIALVFALAPVAAQGQTVSASRLLGAVVFSQDERLGHVIDLAIDLTENRVRYAIVRSDPADSARKAFGVPLPALRPGLQHDRLVVGTDRAATPPTGRERMIRASSLIGREVRGGNGESLGDIRDLAVDLENGLVRYALLERPGQGQPRALPLDALYVPPLRGDAILK